MPGDDCRRLVAKGDAEIAEIRQLLTACPGDERPYFEACISIHERMQQVGRRMAEALDQAHAMLSSPR